MRRIFRHNASVYWLLLVLLLLSAGTILAQRNTHRLGVLAFRPKAEVTEKWRPLIDYLNQSLDGQRIELIVMNFPELEQAITDAELDFVLTNPANYVQMNYRNGLSPPLATLLPIEQGHPVEGFGGVVFVLESRAEINRFEDLAGRTIASVFRGSLGGYQAQALELERIGIGIQRDVTLFETGMPHDRVVMAVLEGRADAGFVRTGVLEAMAAEGRLDLARLKVLNPRQLSDFPFLISTPLYPEWPFAAASHTDPELARRVAAALLALPHDGRVARQIHIHGFAIPQDYEPVRAMLKELRQPPFDEVPHFTAWDVVEKYSLTLLLAAILSIVILLLMFILLLLNRRLGRERRRADRQSEEWQRLLSAMGDGVFGLDAQGRCSFINPAALRMLGFSSDEVIGVLMHPLLHSHHEDGSENPADQCPVLKTLADGETRHLEDWFRRKDGSGLPVLLTATPVESRDRREGAVVVFSDISEQIRLEHELRIQATTDALTGLPNRRHYFDELEAELLRIKRHPDLPAAVLMVDLDKFKQINDCHGHAAGDLVLKHFAQQLFRLSRRIDKLGRLGGEEFSLLLPNTSEQQACQMAERIRSEIEGSEVESQGQSLRYTVSVGVGVMEAGDDSVDVALARADSALYEAKEAGRNRVVLSRHTQQ